jgi:uncharacterized membrane protein YjjP (DUF1212 family)
LCVACDANAMSSSAHSTETSCAERIAFVCDLAWHLHAYGTTSQRLEAAIESVAKQLHLACEPWSNPTGIILSFSDPSCAGGEADTTRIIRPGLGGTNLNKLCEADSIAEEVICGRMGVSEGRAALRALDRADTVKEKTMQALAFALASSAVAGLFRLPWLDIATAGVVGLLIGSLAMAAQTRPRLGEAFEALAGLLAATVAIIVSSFIAPLNLNTVIIASLIVLLPGMNFALASNELSSRHLVSGTARFAGALMTIVSLTIGTAIALAIAKYAGIEPHVRAWRPLPDWAVWCAMLIGAYAFAILFQAQRRDYPLVMLSAACGYLISRYGGEWLGAQAGVFLAALITTVAGNAYARWASRPGALIRLPGIIMLVPGSIALRGVITLIQEQSINAGQEAALAALNTLMALLAGLLFGNLLVTARRSL